MESLTLTEKLKTACQKDDKIQRLFYPDRPLLLADSYIHLALIEDKEEQKNKDKSEDKRSAKTNEKIDGKNQSERDETLHAYERIEASTKINVKDILAKCESRDKRIFIQGGAGSGKSTLCRYIALQWALGHPPWNQFELVLRIPLRELNRYAKFTTPIKLITAISEILHLDEQEAAEINLKSKTTLVLLDGFDELNLVELDYLWQQVKELPNVILTSRPGYDTRIGTEFSLNVGVLGFSNEQLYEYIGHFFNSINTQPDGEENSGKKLISTLKENDSLWSVAHTPINLELICSLYAKEPHSLNSDQTLTELYKKIVYQLLRRYAEKFHPNLRTKTSIKKHLEKYLLFMEHLAFAGMLTGSIVLNEKQINEAQKHAKFDETETDFLKKIQEIGLINIFNQDTNAEFSHLTFQEYFAARFLARHIIELAKYPSKIQAYRWINEFIDQNKRNPKYEVMLWFVAGLLLSKADNEEQIQRNQFLLWQKLCVAESEVKEEKDVKLIKKSTKQSALQVYFDLLLEQQDEHDKYNQLVDICLLVRCLDEAKLSNKVFQQKMLIQRFIHWLDFYFLNFDVNDARRDGEPEIKLAIIPRTLSISSRLIQQKGVLAKIGSQSQETLLYFLPLLKTTHKHCIALINQKTPIERLEIIMYLQDYASLELLKMAAQLALELASENRSFFENRKYADHELERVINMIGGLGQHVTPELKQLLLQWALPVDYYINNEASEPPLSPRSRDDVFPFVSDRPASVESGALVQTYSLTPPLKAATGDSSPRTSPFSRSSEGVINAGLLRRHITPKSMEFLHGLIEIDDEIDKVFAHIGKPFEPFKLTLFYFARRSKYENFEIYLYDMIERLAKLEQKFMLDVLIFTKLADMYIAKTVVKTIGGLGQHATPELIQCLLEVAHRSECKPLKVFLKAFFKSVDFNQGDWDRFTTFLKTTNFRRGLYYYSHDNDPLQKQWVRYILQVVEESEMALKCAVAEAIGNLGQYATRELAQCLLKLARTKDEYNYKFEDPSIRRAVAEAIGNLGQYVTPELIQCLFGLAEPGEYANVRRAALGTLVKLEKYATPRLIHYLPKFTESEDERDAVYSVVAVIAERGQHVTVPQELIQYLVALTKTEMEGHDRGVRSAVIAAVGRLGQHITQELIQYLLNLARNGDENLQCSVVYAIINLGQYAPPKLIQCLCELAKHKNRGVKESVAYAIGHLGQYATPELIQCLLGLAKNEDGSLKISVAHAIGKLGQYATPPLIQCLLELAKNLAESEDSDLKSHIVRIIVGLNLPVPLELLPFFRIQRFCSHCEKINIANSPSYLNYLHKDKLYFIPCSKIVSLGDDDTPENISRIKELFNSENAILREKGGVFRISETEYSVALVRKKDGQHAFLILEGIRAGVRFAIKFDFVDSGRFLPGNSATSSKSKLGQVNVAELDNLNRLHELAENCLCQVFPISAKIGRKLLENCEADKQKNIPYNWLGGKYEPSFWEPANATGKQNCISWCIRQLILIKAPLKTHWFDCVAVVPSSYLPPKKQEPKTTCTLM